MINKIYSKDARKLDSFITENSLDVTITSPPYHNLKDYGHKKQIGFGQTYNDYLDDNSNTIDIESIAPNEAMPIILELPMEFNMIGIIDGQHRVFAYHEGLDKYEKVISSERKKKNLLITGVLYPKTQKEKDKLKFESELFLEINDKQSRVKSDLKQAIQKIVSPLDDVSIAKAVISQMALNGPLENLLEVHFFDTGRIKTTSIVSYGLEHIVRIQGENSLYNLWKHPDKHKLTEVENYKPILV